MRRGFDAGIERGRIGRGIAGLALILFGLAGLPLARGAGSSPERLEATAALEGAEVRVRLAGAPDQARVWADGAYAYGVRAGGERVSGLENVRIDKPTTGTVIRGMIRGTRLEVTHCLDVSAPPGVQETLELRNTGTDPARLEEIAFGMRSVLETSDTLRMVACPFRRQADGKLHDYSAADLVARRFSNSDGHNDAAVTDNQVCDAGMLRSEAWILSRGPASLLVAKYNESAIENSMAAVEETTGGHALRFGGAGLSLFREPRAATLLAPGEVFRFGTTTFLPVEGDWRAGYDSYRAFLTTKGHGLPADYAPPLNWNELFDIGWYHSDVEQLAKHYTREALMGEAAKAKEIGCDLLYLDPGWEICEGTTRWDAKRLGAVDEFVKEIRERFGLRVGYRTIGRVYRDEFPNDWYLRRANAGTEYKRPFLKPAVIAEPVPTARPDGRRNVCLLPGTTVTVSSVIPNHPDIHRADLVIDGWYNNVSSWVAGEDPSWIEIDLGTSITLSEAALGSEHTASFGDRAVTAFEILVSESESPGHEEWRSVLSYAGEPIRGTRTFSFAPASARKVRVAIRSAVGGTARLDEIELYEASPGGGPAPAPRSPQPKAIEGTQINFWELCTESPEWQKEKLKRILEVTRGGMDFMMYDEFDWRGACHNPAHGHPVPSTPEGHVRAVYRLVEEMRRQFPHVLVEAHDPVWPWTCRYLPTYFRQGFAGTRYQENWGFEFMWHPIEDLKSGRAMCLYYYNLGCEIPLYDHITMESDNDASLSFWWYASTVRHLGIGGKKGLNSTSPNEARWQQYKKAVATYNRLRPFYSRGRFVGLDETAHLHVLPEIGAAVLNVFNLGTARQSREVRIDTRKAGLGAPEGIVVSGASATVAGDELILTFDLPAESPALAELAR